MNSKPPELSLSPSDLSGFLSCRHKTGLDLAVKLGLRKRPHWKDPALEVLFARGLEHEKNYASKLAKQGFSVVDLAEQNDRIDKTIAAMRDGAGVILQGALKHDRWLGYPDILRRIERASDLGAWSYEVVDTKLAKETRGGTILQLALYSEMLAAVLGHTPEHFHVVTPDPDNPEQTYRFDDYVAYYRLVRRHLEETATQHPDEIAAACYPELVEHCEVCRWRSQCEKRRRDDDHLSLVAGISRLQQREFEGRRVTTLAQLGVLPVPMDPAPKRGARESYVRVREQARVQLEGRVKNALIHEMLRPITVGEGLTRLPAPSHGDIFLDLEGDPFARDGGREYLFGLVTQRSDSKALYKEFWAYTDAEERVAFEAVMDLIMAAWAEDPNMHVYHYAPYEPAAMKRLMGRYATREAEVDRLLRGGRFIDLHTVVRQSLRASVESYSIKKMEPFYDFTREVPLADARTNRDIVERALELNCTDVITAEIKAQVAGYNCDDCVSTLRLQEWLEKLRAELVEGGEDIPRPAPKEDAPSDALTEREARILELMTQLTDGVPVERAERTQEQHGRWLLAHLLDYHRREDKVAWWEFYRLQDLPVDEYEDERKAISGLQFVKRLDPGKRGAATDQYTYPAQEADIRKKSDLHDANGKFGSVVAVDRIARTIDVKKSVARANDHPTAVFAHSMVHAETLPSALQRIGEAVVANGMAGNDRFRAARSLLLNEPPRLRGAAFAQDQGESAVEFAVRIATILDGTVLAIQGPPGAGKTFTGARMICALVNAGKRVGVTATAHAVIRHLLEKVVEQAAEDGVSVRCAAKVGERRENADAITEFMDNEGPLNGLSDGSINVLGGTAWLWAREDMLDAVDVLVVDEAGQMSLTDVIAASGAANSIVLLGDPQQLEQPQQGSHPEGTDVSALEHILGGARVISDDRGIFLPETWRMAPPICAFCSEVFYEGRLHSRAGLERQRLTGAAPFEGSGLWVVGVEHEGNDSLSDEEADAVEAIVAKLLGDESKWIDADGVSCRLNPDDILVVAPYNRHVGELHDRLAPLDVRVGTVDKFQGREAPVVIYSMATSTPADAPRGMEFLYSLNRLNVATSRARCATILVASPHLFEPECKTPRQIKLANALCRYVEMARRCP